MPLPVWRQLVLLALFFGINWLGIGAVWRLELGTGSGDDRVLLGVLVLAASIALPALLYRKWSARR